MPETESQYDKVKYIHKRNKDDNIHKSEALKREDKRTLTLVECQN